MFTLFVLFVFAWLFVKSVGLAFHVTWGLAKFVATLLFVIALPLLVVFAVVGPELHGGFLSLRCRRGILVVRAFCACYHATKRFFP